MIEHKEAVEKWLAEMRRPDTVKFHRSLENPHNENAMCCLGHACKALKDEFNLKYVNDGTEVTVNNNFGVLPNEVARALNITRHGNFKAEARLMVKNHIMLVAGDDGVKQTSDFIDLMDVNDSTLLSIEEIADLIEYCYKIDAFTEFTDNEQ